jgi:RNA polymerase sigma factor (TIGR02999 family)
LPLVYDELRQLAAAKMAHERAGQKSDATSLVHEAYLRLVGNAEPHWDGRGHFFAAAAEAMRRILVDHARRERRPKHGGDRKRIDLEQCCALAPAATDDVLAVDEALKQLGAQDPAKAQLVKLRYFGGLSLEESAAVLGISLSTAKRHWTYSRAWLYSALTDGSGQAGARRP